jgi:hypothetical protein
VANFTAVYDHGALAGFAKGQARTPHARLLANLSAGVQLQRVASRTARIGDAAGGSAVEVGPRHVRAEARHREELVPGERFSALSQTSITVAA